MIEYGKACEIAYNYYENECEIKGLTDAFECDDVWIFYARKEAKRRVGGVVISVNKMDGIVKNISAPTRENIKLKNEGQRIEIVAPYKRDL